MAWCPFATKLEKADTLEATGLNNYAPLLYSADNRFKTRLAQNNRLGSGSKAMPE